MAVSDLWDSLLPGTTMGTVLSILVSVYRGTFPRLFPDVLFTRFWKNGKLLERIRQRRASIGREEKRQ